MKKHGHMFAASAVALAIVALATTAPASWAQEESEFSELRVLIEINATDGDAGFQVLIDGDEWKEVTIRDPNRMKLFTAKGYGSARGQGLTENFFESAEPSCDELPLADFLARFPSGEYLITGKTIDGRMLMGEANLTHDLPRAPMNLAPTGDGVDPAAPVVIAWTAGVDLGNCPPNGADVGDPAVFGYQVVVEREDPQPLTVFTVDLPASATAVTIPHEFLQADAIYKYEVVAIEARMNEDLEMERGNQTISENFFCTFVETMERPCKLPE